MITAGLLLSGISGCIGPRAIGVGGRVTGEVVDAQGRPAVGVAVQVFTGARFDGQGRELLPQTPERTTTTDAFGRFQLSTSSEAGPVIVEAIQSDDVKAIAQAQIGSEYRLTPVTLKLGPTADVRGRLTIFNPPPDATVEGARIKILGTGYAVQLGSDGAFVFPKVAAGTFRLVADKVGVGHVEVEPLEVAGQPVDLGDLPLRMQTPEVKNLPVPYGGPGAVVTVGGAHFMPRSNETVQVRFGELLGTDVQVRGDGSVSVKVPAGARTGPVSVQVGDRLSTSGPRFQVVGRIELYYNDELAIGEDFSISIALFDTEGLPVPGRGPWSLNWRVEGDAVAYREDVYPRPFVALKPGIAKLIAQTGTVEATTFAEVTGPPSPSDLAGDGISGLRDGPAAQSRFKFPAGVAVDASGTLYIADRGNHAIRKLSPDGHVSTLVDGKDQFNQPQGLTLGPDGALYVADSLNHRIRRVTLDGVVTTWAGQGEAGWSDGPRESARFQVPTGLRFDKAGHLYVADSGNHRIRKISADGHVSTLAGDGTAGDLNGPGASARFHTPSDVAVYGDETILVADTENHRIRAISATGEVSNFAGSGRPGFTETTIANSDFKRPRGLLVDGSTVYIADSGNHTIRRYTPLGLSIFAGTGRPGHRNDCGRCSSFTTPHGLAIDSQGIVYVADEDNHRLRKIIRHPPYKLEPTPQSSR